jgi:hypothetical protein
LFESFNEQKKAVLSFIKEGLQNGEQCVYVSAARSIDDWLLEFQAGGIDVHSEQAKGALKVVASEGDSRPGGLNSIDLARRIWPRIEAGLADFGAIRFAVDMGVSLESGASIDDLCHWEATLNPLIEGEAIRAFCLYDLKGLSPGAIHSALRTHPRVVLRGRAIKSPYYEAPRILENEPLLNHSDADAGMIEAMLARLYALP